MKCPSSADRSPAFYVRLGHFVMGKNGAEDMLMSRSIQICGTWRTHFAWHLAAALGRRA